MVLGEGASPQSFFVSYTGVDRAWAEWIGWVLEAAGLKAVVQAWDFRPGSQFPVEMQKAMVECDRTVAVLSPEYLGARFTQAEWAAAFQADPTGKSGKLLPVRVAEFAPDGIFGGLVFVDLVGLSDQEAQDALIKGIDRGRAKPKKRPLLPSSARQGRSTNVPGSSGPRFPGSASTGPQGLQPPVAAPFANRPGLESSDRLEPAPVTRTRDIGLGRKTLSMVVLIAATAVALGIVALSRSGQTVSDEGRVSRESKARSREALPEVKVSGDHNIGVGVMSGGTINHGVDPGAQVKRAEAANAKR
jgi:hypothetical protein